jgi:hypothetical protein
VRRKGWVDGVDSSLLKPVHNFARDLVDELTGLMEFSICDRTCWGARVRGSFGKRN